MNTKIIHSPEIGDITIKKNKRNKKIRLKVKPTGTVSVSMPYGVAFEQAEEFITAQRDWIIAQLKKIKENYKPPQFIDKNIVQKKAEDYLPARVEALSCATGLKYKSLKIKPLKTYWGQCTVDNRIKLNAHLVRLPDELIDYVILHELAHTREKNHGRGFYDLLGRFVESPRTMSKIVKRYRP